jgi:hypothetical protein
MNQNFFECSICTEKITKKRHLIECPFCQDDSVCVECAKTHVLSTNLGGLSKPGDRGCIYCNKKWELEYIEYMFGDDVKKEYIAINKLNILEREKSLFAATQPFVEYTRFKNNTLNDITQLQDIRGALLDRIDEVEQEIRMNVSKIRNTKPGDIDKTQYIMACPSTPDQKDTIAGDITINITSDTSDTDDGDDPAGCKGFIDSKTWRCNLCSSLVCDKCHVIIPNLKKTLHKCKATNVSSVNLIMKDTKPCPNCATRIQKIDGCSQMFCTSCLTGFNWGTMKIVTGVIHNPHYYDMIRDGAIKEEGRVAGDIPCGGMPDFWRIGITSYNINRHIHDTLVSYHQLAVEIEDYLVEIVDLKTGPELFTNLRVKYILNEIGSEKEYLDKLYELDRYIFQFKIEKESLETLLAIFSERYRGLSDEAKNIMSQTRASKHLTKIKNILIPLHQRKKNLNDYLENMIEELRFSIEMTNETFVSYDIYPIDIPDPVINKTNSNVRTIPMILHYKGFRDGELKTRARDNMLLLDIDDDMYDSDE